MGTSELCNNRFWVVTCVCFRNQHARAPFVFGSSIANSTGPEFGGFLYLPRFSWHAQLGKPFLSESGKDPPGLGYKCRTSDVGVDVACLHTPPQFACVLLALWRPRASLRRLGRCTRAPWASARGCLALIIRLWHCRSTTWPTCCTTR